MRFPPASALLPAGLRDMLPPDAWAEAHAVWQTICHLTANGYELVKPPLLEFEDTLLSGSGQSLARHSFRLMDSLSQQMMALRADMTPQVARIAGSRLANAPRPLRLAYAGEVMRISGTQLRPERQSCQIGCELIGSDSIHADAEIILLAVEALDRLGAKGVSVDLNLPTFVPNLLKSFDYSQHDADELAAAVERRHLTRVQRLSGEVTAIIDELIASSGPVDTALPALAKIEVPGDLRGELDRLADVVALVKTAMPDLSLTVDCVERRGFEYQTGLSFTLFVQDAGEVGRGGRYLIGRNPGETATGFTLTTDNLLRAVEPMPSAQKVYLPVGTSSADRDTLQAQGYITIKAMVEAPIGEEAARLGCQHIWDGSLIPIVGE